MFLGISICRFLVVPVLWLSHFFNDNNFVLVCKGYDNDWKYYTGLYWEDDKNNDFTDYKDFKVWLKF